MLLRIFLLFILQAFGVAALFAQVPAPVVPEKNLIEKAIATLVSDPELTNAAISFQVKSLKSGKIVAEHNPDLSLVPASIMKLITTATALEILGGAYTFKTELQYTGQLDTIKRILYGDLYIKGGGDPTLGSKYFAKDNPGAFLTDWALAVKALGIDSITGNIIADAEIYGWENVPSTWVWGDIGNGYGTAPNGLSIYDNICVLKFNTGSKAGDTAYIECINPFVPDLEFFNEVRADNTNSDNAYIFGAPYSNARQIKGSLPKGKEGFEVKGSIPDPSFLTAFELRHALGENGIVVGGKTTTVRLLKMEKSYQENDRVSFYVHKSPGLAGIVSVTNHYSVNLFAEHMINQVGLVTTGNAHVISGTTAAINFWAKKGIDTKGLYISDGSGLSRFDGVSASHMVSILSYMNSSKSSTTFFNSLPIAGKSGTLATIGKGTAAQGKIFAKSGTMTRVKSYAGFAKNNSGNMMAFTIIINNYNCTTKEIERRIEKVMVAMANFNE